MPGYRWRTSAQWTYSLTTACPEKHNFRPKSLRHLNLLYQANEKLAAGVILFPSVIVLIVSII